MAASQCSFKPPADWLSVIDWYRWEVKRFGGLETGKIEGCGVEFKQW